MTSSYRVMRANLSEQVERNIKFTTSWRIRNHRINPYIHRNYGKNQFRNKRVTMFRLRHGYSSTPRKALPAAVPE